MKYRADIDGLRAVAVLSVLTFHLGAPWLPGGFIGVDVFFVISGYLITKNLAEQIEVSGLSLTDFYDRRIRRILPAALVVVFTTVLAGYLLLLPGDYASLGKSAAYSAFGAGNLFFFWNTGYFDREALLCPPSFIQLKPEPRVEIDAVARVEQRTIGGAGRGCGADCPLR